ncbi:MAG: hypothetical protein AB1668_06930, partial [Nanoarchaeota archaeon]
MINETINLLSGIAGMLCILTAFVLDEFFNKWSRDTVKYNLMNIVGSGLLIYYAYTLASWPFIILNSVWMLVAAIKLG